MSAGEPARNPFGLTTSLNAYVPRRATEQALAALARAMRGGQRPAALIGPRGMGKTLLLHLLADRMGHELRFVYLPYGTLPPAELCAWALGRLLLPQSADPGGALRARATELQQKGSALLLLVDDVAGMPLETARWLGSSFTEWAGALRLAVAAADGPAVGPVLAALHAEVEVVRLDAPMTEPETLEYVLTRLELAGAPAALQARFDRETLASLHRLSEGVPGQLHALASAVIRGVSTELVERFLEEAKENRPPREEPPAAAARPALPRGARRDRLAAVRERLAGPRAPAPPPRSEPSRAPAAAPRPRARAPLRPPTGARVLATGLGAALGLAALVALRPPLPEPPPRPPPPGLGDASSAGAGEAGRGAGGEAAGTDAPAPRAASEPVQVQVNAIPWALVEVDGVDIGMTPRAGIPLLPGPHRFRARMPDGRVIERTVEIGARSRHVVFE